MKKMLLFIFIILIFVNGVFAETISLDYSLDSSELIFTKQSVSTTAYDYVYTDDSAFDATVGYPSIPYKIIKVIIPRGKNVQSVTVNNISWQPVTGNYTLYPIQQSITSGAKATFDFPDSTIYSSSVPYPSESVTEWVE